MAKHAYLIIAHKCDKTLKTLIELLDYKDNDIFIHMDKKLKGYNSVAIEKLAKQSKVYHTKRTRVQWGGYSQIRAELVVLKKAIETGHYDYYHLLSGEDLPLKTQSEIHKFFDKNQGKEFLEFQAEKFSFDDRVRYWYPLQERLGRRHPGITRRLVSAQRRFVWRNKGVRFQKGANWFSITDDFARYVASKEKWVKKVFKKTWCADEVFLQTILINSKFKNNIYRHKNSGKWDDTCCAREIDWERGEPYTFRLEDYDMLMKSDMCFARKFNAEIDAKIIDKIKKHLQA